MKLHDYICKSIYTWPTLYLVDNFESSKIRVLDHLFGTLGSGITWAHVKNPKQGGYCCEKRYRKYNGDYVRIYDKPYGKEKFNIDINKLYSEPLIEVYDRNKSRSIFIGYIEEYNNHPERITWEGGDTENQFVDVFDIKIGIDISISIYKNVRKHNLEYLSSFGKTDLKFYGWDPYPYFEKKYSPLWKAEVEYIQSDWREGALYWLNECKEFLLDEQRVKTYCRYPSKNNIKDFKEYVLKEMKTKTVEEINEMYEIKSFTGDNFEEVEMERWENTLNKALNFIDETIERLS